MQNASNATDTQAALSRYQFAVNHAVATGRLPAGLSVSVTIEQPGGVLFDVIKATVNACPVLVICPERARKGKRATVVLNQTGMDIRKALQTIATDNHKALGSVTFEPSLLDKQVAFVKGLAEDADGGSGLSVLDAPALPPSASIHPIAPALRDFAAGCVLVADKLAPRIASGTFTSNAELFAIADEAFGGTQAHGVYTAKDAYEAAEFTLNRVILTKAAQWSPNGPLDHALSVALEIDAMAKLLPNQTRRDQDMVELQQFSTPAAYAYLCAWAAGISGEDEVLEPSAGNGAFAVHATNAGARQLHTNEISPRRLAILKALGYNPRTENAEQIHNILDGLVSPTVVLMNPPFSRTVRTNRIDPAIAGQHVEAAMKLLRDGGRLVAITGKSTGAGGPGGSWLTRLRSRYALRANIMVSGKLFCQNGTTVETRVLVLDKVRDDAAPIMGEAHTLDDLAKLLASVRRSEAEKPNDARFAPYRPAKLHLGGAKPHPDKLVESWAMSAIASPDLHYTPAFPSTVWQDGLISDVQLEAVCYAGQAHSQDLTQQTDGIAWRRGYAIGSGTGVGKGRKISAIIYDNQCRGAHRHIWVTSNDNKLLAAARRDLAALGVDKKHVFSLRATAGLRDDVDRDGIMVASVGTLRSQKPSRSRVDQIVEWAGGSRFNGVLVIDEGHKAGNGLDKETERGTQLASQTAMAAIELQRRLPRAKVVYVSATQADRPENLAYAQRLGLFGPGTEFASAADFCAAINAAGVAGMEVVARDMKALGIYMAPTLSMEGVVYERLVHELTPDQEAVYNRLAEIWQTVFQNVEDAMEAAGSTKARHARSAALSAFYGAQMRFFNQVLISFQMPSVLACMEKDLATGCSPVIQLVNTLEAQQERALAEEGAMENLEDLDLTPRDILAQYLLLSFPTRAFEEVQDAEGNKVYRPVVDAGGNPVECAEALRMREELLAEVGQLRVPFGPLELILNKFGVDKVAELTGRSRRVVNSIDPASGMMVKIVQNRTEAAVLADLRAFWDDVKPVCVFSGAGAEGIDLHAGRQFKNQRKRRHYVVQAGFSSKTAAQSMGRTKRTDAVSDPDYILVSTNLAAQMRFTSAMAKRLGALGAMTKGQRDTASGGLYSERDNLETVYAEAAVAQLVREVYQGGSVAGYTLADFETKLGLKLVDEDGSLIMSKIPPVRRFLNRLLAQKVTDGNALFQEFIDRADENVQAAIDAGTYNVGVETYRAERVEVISAPRTVYRDPSTGALTNYVHLKAHHKRSALDFDLVASGAYAGKQRTVLYFVRETAEDGTVWAVMGARNRMGDRGELVQQVRLVSPYAEKFVDSYDVENRWGSYQRITEPQARKMWAEQSKADEWYFRDLHLITGVLLPVWRRIDGSWRVYRVVDESGHQHLGRVVAPGMVRQTLAKLGASLDTAWSPAEVVQTVRCGVEINLANGWKLVRARVSNDHRVELIGWTSNMLQRLREMGLILEYISYRSRAFVPLGNFAALEALLEMAPIVDEATQRVAA